MEGNLNMKKILFPYSFSVFGDLNFINCFSSYYLYINKLNDTSNSDCSFTTVGKCDGCGHCNDNNLISGMQWFFETIVGNTSTRGCLNEEFRQTHHRNNFETVDFLLQFAGLEYAIHKNDMIVKTAISIENGYPVFARMKNADNNEFRLIIGCDENTGEIVNAGTDGENGRPKGSPLWEEIEEIIVITKKSEPTKNLIDAFQRIINVLENNVKQGGLWDDCIQGFTFKGGVKIDMEELERRFKAMREAAFHNFNSHFFAEQFRKPVYEPLKDNRLDDVRRKIDKTCDTAHLRNWQMVSLYEFRGDWSKKRDNVKEWGYATSMLDCIKALKQCDKEILLALIEAAKILK